VLSPVVAAEINGAEHFLFGADNGLFYALNATGKKVWSFATKGKIRTEALVHEGRVYFGSEDNSFYALDLRTGKPVFTCRVDGNIYGKPVVHEGRIYFGATDGFIHSLYI